MLNCFLWCCQLETSTVGARQNAHEAREPVSVDADPTCETRQAYGDQVQRNSAANTTVECTAWNQDVGLHSVTSAVPPEARNAPRKSWVVSQRLRRLLRLPAWMKLTFKCRCDRATQVHGPRRLTAKFQLPNRGYKTLASSVDRPWGLTLSRLEFKVLRVRERSAAQPGWVLRSVNGEEVDRKVMARYGKFVTTYGEYGEVVLDEEPPGTEYWAPDFGYWDC